MFLNSFQGVSVFFQHQISVSVHIDIQINVFYLQEEFKLHLIITKSFRYLSGSEKRRKNMKLPSESSKFAL